MQGADWWVGNLIEFRERLKCSNCGNPKRPMIVQGSIMLVYPAWRCNSCAGGFMSCSDAVHIAINKGIKSKALPYDDMVHVVCLEVI